MTLGKQIKHCRTARNLSQPELAEMMGIEQSYLSKLENDKSVPSNEVFRSLLNALSMNLTAFLSGIDTKKYRQLLNQIADIETILSEKDNLKVRSLRRFLYVASALLILGITSFYTGFSKQVFSENQYQYQSLGIVLAGEPLDIYSSWSHTIDTSIEGSHSIREQKRVEMAKRRDVHYLLTTDNRSQRFNINVDGGKRMYSLDKEVLVSPAINAWLQLFGVLFFAAGIVGFSLERHLYQRQ